VNWDIEEVLLSPDGKSIKPISGDMELTRNKHRAFIDKVKFSGRSGARSKEAMISLIVSNSKTARVYKDTYIGSFEREYLESRSRCGLRSDTKRWNASSLIRNLLRNFP